MAKRSDNEEEKIMKATIQKRFDSMFSGKNQPLANVSIQEVEALKSRIAELEGQVGQQPEAVEKPSILLNETMASPSIPPAKNRMLQVLDRLSYPRKFIVISLLFLLPLMVFYPLVNEQVQRIENYGYQELRGAEYIHALDHLLIDVQAYEIEAGRFYLGEISRSQLKPSETQVDLSLEELQTVHLRNGAPMGLSDEPSRLSTEWNAIKSNVAEGQAVDSQQSQFVQDIQDFMFKVGNNSYLILDPDLDTYYTMDAVLLKIPVNQALLSQILDVSNEATRAQRLTPEQHAELTVLIGRMRTNIEALNTNLDVALQNNKSGPMQPLIADVLPDYSAKVLGFLNNVEQEVAASPSIELDPETLLSEGKQVIATQEQFFDNVSEGLQLGIQGRINALTTRLLLGLGLVVITAVAAFVSGLSVMRAISQPLQSLTAAAKRLATGDLTARAQVLSADEVGQTAAAFNSMADQLGESLTALTDRTRDLTLATDVSQRIAEVRDIGLLLTDAVELIQTRFNLYYAQVYLLDGVGQNLILRAGTGEVGKKLLEGNFRLPVTSASLNGIAAMEQRPVIISDTAQTATFRPNPLLPNTRSEMCVPLRSGDRILGVLDLQSERPGTFSEDNLPVFNALVGQLTIALQNTALYAQAHEAQSDLEAQIRGRTENGWQEFLNAIERGERLSYAFDQDSVIPAELAPSVSDERTLTVPISVTGAEVGAIQLPKVADQTVSEEETEIAQAIAEVLARHIENLRLLAQADQYRVRAEEAARRLTREAWDSYLQTYSETEAGYVYDLTEVKPLSGQDDDSVNHAIKYPVQVRAEMIGEMVVDVSEQSDEIDEILTAVTEQLSGHLENLRLSELNEIRAQREHTLRQITIALRSSTNPATIMRTAAREIGSILGRKTVVQLATPEQAKLADPAANNKNASGSPANHS